jgi:hypothetical protein
MQESEMSAEEQRRQKRRERILGAGQNRLDRISGLLYKDAPSSTSATTAVSPVNATPVRPDAPSGDQRTPVSTPMAAASSSFIAQSPSVPRTPQQAAVPLSRGASSSSRSSLSVHAEATTTSAVLKEPIDFGFGLKPSSATSDSMFKPEPVHDGDSDPSIPSLSGGPDVGRLFFGMLLAWFAVVLVVLHAVIDTAVPEDPEEGVAASALPWFGGYMNGLYKAVMLCQRKPQVLWSSLGVLQNVLQGGDLALLYTETPVLGIFITVEIMWITASSVLGSMEPAVGRLRSFVDDFLIYFVTYVLSIVTVSTLFGQNA